MILRDRILRGDFVVQELEFPELWPDASLDLKEQYSTFMQAVQHEYSHRALLRWDEFWKEAFCAYGIEDLDEVKKRRLREDVTDLVLRILKDTGSWITVQMMILDVLDVISHHVSKGERL